MKQKYHILNGDNLKEQFPKQILGETIINRECLVDGNVHGSTLDELFINRSKIISKNYEGSSEEEYFQVAVSEFKKMQIIPIGAEINLWFEDDLFCQVNFWFVISLLIQKQNNFLIYLVRPNSTNKYSFGGMNESELNEAFKNKTKMELSEIKKIGELWNLYQKDDCERMLQISKGLEEKYPFLTPSIKAHIDRIPKKGNWAN
jgi:hypothetical protein